MQARRALIPAIVFAVLVLGLFWPIWFPIGRRAFVYDALWEYWGDLQIQLAALSHGSLPLWNPFDRGGYPFHADIQAGTLYPLQWPFIALAALIGPVHELVSAKVLLHYWLAGFGMYLFVQRRGMPPAGGYLAGVLVLLVYPFSHAMFSAIIWSAAWAPWMMLALDAWGERPTARRGAVVGLTFALSFLAGAPAGFFYAAMAALPFGVWRLVTGRPSWKPAVGSGAVALAVFALLAAAQADATRGLMALSVRSERDLDFIGTTAFTADDLFGFLVPRMPGEGCYLGLLGALFVALALVRRPRGDTLVFGGTAVFAVLVAWGNLAPFLPALASALPPFGFFRRAHRFLFTLALALAPVAAAGLAALLEAEPAERRRLSRRLLVATGALALVFAVGLVANLGRGGGPRGPHIPRWVSERGPFLEPFGFGLGATLVAAFVVWRLGVTRRAHAWAVAAALILFADLWVARLPAIDRNWTALPDTRRDARLLALADVVDHQVRFMDRELLKWRPGARLGLRDFGGYEDDPLALVRSERALREAVSAPRLLGHGNVRWLFEEGRKVTPKSAADRAAMRDHGRGLWEIAVHAPAVMWTENVQVVSGHEQAFARLRETVPGSAAFVEAPLSRAGTGVVAGRLAALSWDHAVAEVDAPGPGVVVIHEAYYPGWEATVDGAAAAIVPANGAWRGVAVGPGSHRIELRYPARRYRALVIVELATLVVLAAWAIAGRRRDRRSSRG